MSRSTTFTEEQLNRLGIAVVGDKAAPVPSNTPDDTWNLDQLAAYATGQIAESILQSHKSAVALFRAGCALAHARTRCKERGHGDWTNWKRQHRLADTTVNDAIRLYEGARSEAALNGMGITEAKERFVYPVKNGGATTEDKSVRPSRRTAIRRRVGVGAARTAVNENGGSDDDGDTPAAADAASNLEPKSLPVELEEIAQRVNEIVQDDSGKIDWSVESYDHFKNAALALGNAAARLLRWLAEEKPHAA